MRWALLVVALAACNADIDEPWQLAHDRIIAVRATPPRITAGGQSSLDVLLGYADDKTAQRPPDVAQVISPESLADLVAPEGGQWIVRAPDDQRLAAARAAMSLDEGAPVPLIVGVAVAWPYPVMSPDMRGFGASKTIWLGEIGDNPPLDNVLVDGVPPGEEIVVPKETKVTLHVEADDSKDIVNWLTSCGTMHDFDLHDAYLRVEPEDPQEGELALIVRDERGGVAWKTWPIRAE